MKLITYLMSQQIKEKVNIVRIYQVERSTLIKTLVYLLFLIWFYVNSSLANEQEIVALINAKSFEEVISFSREIKKTVIITRGEKGAISINSCEIIECDAQKNLKIKDLTGAGDLFAAGYLHGVINNLSTHECLNKGTELSSKIIQKIGARI